MNSLKSDAIKKVFGAQKLTGADVSAVSALVALGPWGVALIAAYLAGQGLVKLAEKIQAMRGPTAPAIPLTSEEETQIRSAIQAIETERFAQTYPETLEWIKEHPPEAIGISKIAIGPLTNAQNEFDDALTELIQSPPNDPKRKDLCDRLLRAMPKLELWVERLGTPNAAIERMFKLAYEWLDKKGCGSRWSNR